MPPNSSSAFQSPSDDPCNGWGSPESSLPPGISLPLRVDEKLGLISAFLKGIRRGNLQEGPWGFFTGRAYFHLYLGKMQGTLRGVEPSVVKLFCQHSLPWGDPMQLCITEELQPMGPSPPRSHCSSAYPIPVSRDTHRTALWRGQPVP